VTVDQPRTGARYIPLADKAIRSGILGPVHVSIMAREPRRKLNQGNYAIDDLSSTNTRMTAG
jgi:hypothetical protein